MAALRMRDLVDSKFCDRVNINVRFLDFLCGEFL